MQGKKHGTEQCSDRLADLGTVALHGDSDVAYMTWWLAGPEG
jgi:hypothetical protein